MGTSWGRGPLSALILIGVLLLSGCSEAPPDLPAPPAESAPPPTDTVAEAPVDPLPLPSSEARGDIDSALLAEIDAAADRLRTALNSAVQWHNLGEALHRARQFELAESAYLESSRLAPDAAEPRFQLALLAERRGDMDRAIEAMHAAQERAPAFAPAAWRLALLLLESDQTDEAIIAAQNALRIDPADINGRLVLARALLRMNRESEALRVLETIPAEDSAAPYARQLTARALRRLGRHEEADHLTELGFGGHEWTDAWQERSAPRMTGDAYTLRTAIALSQRGRPDRAVTLLEELLTRHADDVDVRINLGLAYRLTGRLDDAEAQLHAALTITDHEMAHLHLAGVQRQRVEQNGTRRSEWLEKGMHHAREVLRISPELAAGHSMLGELLLLGGDHDAAMESFGRAIQVEPTNPIWPQRRGMVFVELGRWSEAVADFRRYRDRAPRDPMSYLLLGSALVNSGQRSEGTSILEAGLTIDPEHAALRRALEQVRAASASGG